MLICETTRKGKKCTFMSTQGCSFNGGSCAEIIEACTGCNRSEEHDAGWFCAAFPEPSVKWKNGNCNLATHLQQTAEAKSKINPIKASKRRGK